MKISLPITALVLLILPMAITFEAGASEPVSISESASTSESVTTSEAVTTSELDSGVSEEVASESLTSEQDAAFDAVSCLDMQGSSCGPGTVRARCYDYQYCEWHVCLCESGTFNCEA